MARKTADEWNRDPDAYWRRGRWIVWDPDSYPRGDPDAFQREWFETPMTEQEFTERVGASTVGPWLWGAEPPRPLDIEPAAR